MTAPFRAKMGAGRRLPAQKEPVMPSFGALVLDAQLSLGMTQEQFGRLIGASRRTVQRYTRSGHFDVLPSRLPDLVKAIFPKDAELAAAIAQAQGTTLEALGVVPKAPPPAPAPAAPSGPAPALAHLGDSIVYAAADAIDVTTKVARPAVIAALARARAMGLDLDAALRALTPAAPIPPPKAPAPRRTTRR